MQNEGGLDNLVNNGILCEGLLKGRGGHIYPMEIENLATSIFNHKRVKYESLPSFRSISPLHRMTISILITTTITTDTTEATTITTTTTTNTDLLIVMRYI